MGSRARHLAPVTDIADRQPFSTRPPAPPPVEQGRRRPPPLLPEEHDALPEWFRAKLKRHAPGVVPPGDPLFGLDDVGGIPPGRDGVPPEVGNPG